MPEPTPYDDGQILRLVDEWREGDYVDSLDRAELSRHFGGGALDPDSEDQFGMVGKTNFLLGYRYLNKAYQEHYSIYSRGRGFVEVKVKQSLTPERRRYVEHCANEVLNKVIKDSKRLRYPYAATCGDAILYGSPFLWRWDKYDWCPRYAGKPLMPRDAPADIHDDEFQLWAFRANLSLGDILRQIKRAERTKGDGGGRWNVKALRSLLKSVFDQKKPETNTGMTYVIDAQDAEQIEYDAQSNAKVGKVLAGSVPCYYFFNKRVDKKGEIDCYVVSRLGESVAEDPERGSLNVTRSTTDKNGNAFPTDRLLFKEEGRFKDVGECLFPFLLDCNIGGRPNMHRVLGLGKLNYDLDYKINELINMGIAGVEDDFSPLYEAQDTATIEQLEQYMRHGLRRNGIIPAGIRPVDRGTRTKNYAQLFGFTNLFSEQQGLNSAAYAGSQSTQRGQRELEVEALERQAENARAVNNRMTAWLESGDCLVKAMVQTLLDQALLPVDKGYPEHEKIKEELAAKGIALEELDLDLIEVRMQRLPGGGDQSLAMARAEKKLRNLALYDPESQRQILREWTLANDDSFERAMELVPEAPTQDPDQVMSAQMQNAVALSSGIPPQVMPGDIAGIHLPLHLQPIQGMLQSGVLDIQQARGAMALLQHAQSDAQLLAAVDEATAREVIQQIQEMAAMVQKMAEAGAPQSPEMVRAQQQQERIDLDRQKTALKAQQWSLAQDFRERNNATETALRMNQESRADEQLRTNARQREDEIALKRAKLLLDATTAAGAESGSGGNE